MKPIRNKLVDRPTEIEANIYLPADLIKKYEVDSFEKLEINSITPEDRKRLIRHLTKEMFQAADKLNFELAAKLRDRINEIRNT